MSLAIFLSVLGMLATFTATAITLTWRFSSLVTSLQATVRTLEVQVSKLATLEAIAAGLPALERRIELAESEITKLRDAQAATNVALARRERLPSTSDT